MRIDRATVAVPGSSLGRGIALVSSLLGALVLSPVQAASSQATLNCKGETGVILSGSWKLDAAGQKTQAYLERGLIVGRPGGEVDITLTFDKNPERACFEFDLMLVDSHTDSAVVAMDFRPVSEVVVQKGSFTQTYRATLPRSLAIGRYAFAAELGGSGDDAGSTQAADDNADRFVIGDAGASGTRLSVVFNPYDSASPTWIGEAASSYLEASTAKLSLDDGHVLTFDIDPFAPEVVTAALDAVATLSYAERQDPAAVLRRVQREISYVANQMELRGRWDGNYKEGSSPRDFVLADYGDGKKPWEWTGSTEILKSASGGKARYGQCWVFSGLLTSMSRALGIPGRSVANIAFVSERGGDYRAAYHPGGAGFLHTTSTATVFVSDGKGGRYFDEKQSRDAIWSFHVWNEAWFRTDPATQKTGWNAYDGTCQEASDGRAQCGPVPVGDILSGKYDTAFIAGESDAEVQAWLN